MLEVRLLGPVEALRDGDHLDLGGARQRCLLAALAVQPGQVVSADRLVDIIWSSHPPAGAEGTLHSYVSRLRKSIGPHHIETRPPGYALTGAAIDIARFEELSRAEDRPSLEEALELWRGEPFGELDDREPFRSEALRLLETREIVEERRAAAMATSDPDGAVAELEVLCGRAPLRERRWILLARALAATGRQAEALRAVDRARHALAGVGLEPSSALTEAEDELLTGAPSPAIRSRPGVGVPHRRGPLMGRDQELSDLRDALASRRLITLTGPGGVGKTSLAMATTAGMPEAYWCDLGPHDEPPAVVPAISRAVGAPLSGTIEETLLSSLRHRQVVIVIDGCEHLVDEVARMTDLLLTTCPEVTILATSREPLAVPGEWVMPVRPLPPATAATELFIERARAAGVPGSALGPEIVARICEMLDGLPLAVEMAAARARALDLSELERRLRANLGVLVATSRTAPSRHRTLEAVVDWSAGLLEPDQRRALRRATAFSGSFDLEAAQAVIGGDSATADRLPDLLTALVDRSLITTDHRGDGRTCYRMLQTVRRVLGDQPDPDGEEATSFRRHAEFFAAESERIAETAHGPDEAEWAARALDRLPDLRLAIFRSVERGWHDLAVATCAHLFEFAYERLRADVTDWAESLFEIEEDSGHPQVPALGAMAALSAIQRGDLAAANRLVGRATEIDGSDESRFRVLQIRSDLATYAGRFETAVATGELMMAMAGDDLRRRAMALHSQILGWAYLGDPDRALDLMDELREVSEDVDSDTLRSWADYVEGEVLLDREPGRAADLLDRAVRRARSTGATFVEGVASVSAASVRARHGDADVARRRFADTIRRWQEIGDWHHQWVTLRNLPLLLDRLGDPEGAAIVLAAVTGRGEPAHGEEAVRLERFSSDSRLRLGEDVLAGLEAAGRRLGNRELVDVALERLDGAGTDGG